MKKKKERKNEKKSFHSNLYAETDEKSICTLMSTIVVLKWRPYTFLWEHSLSFSLFHTHSHFLSRSLSKHTHTHTYTYHKHIQAHTPQCLSHTLARTQAQTHYNKTHLIYFSFGCVNLSFSPQELIFWRIENKVFLKILFNWPNWLEKNQFNFVRRTPRVVYVAGNCGN